jgi:hypothetical protein
MSVENNEFNYSLGVLIVLLIVFWAMCKCIGNNQDPNNHHRQRQYQREPFKSNSRFLYGNTPVALSGSPIPYIRMNKTDTVLVPNSKSAYRHLTDHDEYKCGSDTTLDSMIDKELSTMFLKKKRMSNNTKIPSGLTSQRNLQDTDRMNRTPMASY